jgi:hypothetical protein
MDRAYSASMGDIVTSSSSPCCHGRRRRDLTAVIPGLSGWSVQERGRRHRGFERANEGAASETGLGRGGYR